LKPIGINSIFFRDWNKFHAVPADPINPSIKETFSNVMISLADFKIETI
jgi:hypothetical protein